MHEVSFEPNTVNWEGPVPAAEALRRAEAAAVAAVEPYGHAEIVDALDGALAEHPGVPDTVWLSFWDRLTEGGPIPPRP